MATPTITNNLSANEITICSPSPITPEPNQCNAATAYAGINYNKQVQLVHYTSNTKLPKKYPHAAHFGKVGYSPVLRNANSHPPYNQQQHSIYKAHSNKHQKRLPPQSVPYKSPAPQPTQPPQPPQPPSVRSNTKTPSPNEDKFKHFSADSALTPQQSDATDTAVDDANTANAAKAVNAVYTVNATNIVNAVNTVYTANAANTANAVNAVNTVNAANAAKL